MVRNVTLGEEIVISANNRPGLLGEIAKMLSAEGINIEAASGFGTGRKAKLFIITNANITIVSKLKKKYKNVKEIEVVMVDIVNAPGALKTITTILGKNKIDIKHLYVTSPTSGDSAKMVMVTSNNEAAMALLTDYIK